MYDNKNYSSKAKQALEEGREGELVELPLPAWVEADSLDNYAGAWFVPAVVHVSEVVEKIRPFRDQLNALIESM